MNNLIGLNIEQAKQIYKTIRITSIDGNKLNIDKKHMPSRRNVQIKNGKIISESGRG